MTTTAHTDPTSPSHPGTATRRLLRCGLIAAPLFPAVLGAQILTRDGFDPTWHFISQLATGGPGWIQIANFVVTGALVTACAVGLHRTMRGCRGGSWGPRLIGIYGVGLIVAGVFVTDPQYGFPVGAPEGAVDPSRHGILHNVGPLTLDVFIVGCLVLARYFHGVGRRGWTVACVVVGLGLLAVLTLPLMTVRMAVGGVITLVFVAALAGHALAGRA